MWISEGLFCSYQRCQYPNLNLFLADIYIMVVSECFVLSVYLYICVCVYVYICRKEQIIMVNADMAEALKTSFILKVLQGAQSQYSVDGCAGESHLYFVH